MEKYILTRRKGMKNLRMRLSDDGTLLVSAPYGVSRERIDKFVEEHSEWTAKQRQSLPQNSTELHDGSEIIIFGDVYTVRAECGAEGCTECGRTLLVTLPEPQNTAQLEQLVLAYMAERCREVLEAAFTRYLELSGYKGKRPSLRLAMLKSKWGSCSRRTNVITLNLMLCKLPQRFAEYVAAHEVVHLFVPDHSDEFYAAGERLYAGFRATDRELNRKRIAGIFS